MSPNPLEDAVQRGWWQDRGGISSPFLSLCSSQEAEPETHQAVPHLQLCPCSGPSTPKPTLPLPSATSLRPASFRKLLDFLLLKSHPTCKPVPDNCS